MNKREIINVIFVGKSIFSISILYIHLHLFTFRENMYEDIHLSSIVIVCDVHLHTVKCNTWYLEVITCSQLLVHTVHTVCNTIIERWD